MFRDDNLMNLKQFNKFISDYMIEKYKKAGEIVSKVRKKAVSRS